MHRRRGRLIGALAAAAAAAMLVSALPASMAAAKSEAGCKVHNLGTGSNRSSLQRAVWAADPGDALLVQGTCTGTTLVDKDLDVSYLGWAGAPLPLGKQYRTSPRGRIVSGDGRPALVIDPQVDDFRINPGLRVGGGIVIDDLDGWRGDSRPVSAAWEGSAASTIATASSGLSACLIRNDESGDEFEGIGEALEAAGPGDQLSLRGTCAGETVIDHDLLLAGWRLAISSMQFGSAKVQREDSGPPTLTRVAVDDDVESLVLKRLRVIDGFSIADLEP